jgi:hypothetical protein
MFALPMPKLEARTPYLNEIKLPGDKPSSAQFDYSLASSLPGFEKLELSQSFIR